MRGLRIFAAILLNLTIVLSAVYVEYHILDHFNPMLSFINGSTLPIVPYLSVIIPILFILSVLLYGLLPHVAAVLSYPAYGAIKLIAIVAQNLDVPALRLPAPHPAVIVLYYIALLLCSPLLLLNRKRPPWIGLRLLTVSIALWFLI